MEQQSDHPIYMMEHAAVGEWSAQILRPGSQQPEVMEGYENGGELIDDLTAKYGAQARRVSPFRFDKEVERRTTHSPQMLALLQNTYAGDLRGWHVYGSGRPMSGIRIEGAVFLNTPPGTTYQEHWDLYAYVCSKEPLDEGIQEHYSLVVISHPAAANQG